MSSNQSPWMSGPFAAKTSGVFGSSSNQPAVTQPTFSSFGNQPALFAAQPIVSSSVVQPIFGLQTALPTVAATAPTFGFSVAQPTFGSLQQSVFGTTTSGSSTVSSALSFKSTPASNSSSAFTTEATFGSFGSAATPSLFQQPTTTTAIRPTFNFNATKSAATISSAAPVFGGVGTSANFGQLASSSFSTGVQFNFINTSSSTSSQPQTSSGVKPFGNAEKVPLLFGKPIAAAGSESTVLSSQSDNNGLQLKDAKRTSPFKAAANKPIRGGAVPNLFSKTIASLGAANQHRVNIEPSSSVVENQIDNAALQAEDVIDVDAVAGEGDSSSSAAPGMMAPKLIRRRVSSEDVAIVVRQLPDTLTSQVAVRKHFSKFGEITRLFVNQRQHSASISFKTHEAAKKAVQSSGQLLPDGQTTIQIFWRASKPERRASVSSSPGSEGKPAGSNSQRLSSNQVDDELASMRGTDDPENVAILQRKPVAISHAQEDVENVPRRSLRVQEQQSPRKTRGKRVVEEAGGSVEGSSKPALNKQAGKHDQGKHSLGENPLAALKNSVGHTAGEKYAILDEQEKILRSIRSSSQQSRLFTSQVTRGTCPDMCPEKERYMREDRRRLNVYEMVPGTDRVEHARAVKEYSRSSADQDMPLPQELRPPEVLNATMNYLLNNIMDDGGPGRWENWFNFLWDRTRSIRKDITQQHLYDLVAVSLVEKCSRFHIFCSEGLCEEDMAVFDPKINNENLTKCLQTLKELYADLGTKQNIHCPCEAEFRAYIVLMNLNEGDILREVQQLRDNVRESPEVKFAIRVYSALNSNNYVKFFKLVGSATFLSACIMHRYFNQVRAYALQRILRAYVLPGHNATYPLSELVRQLAFEDDSDAKDFCEHHGLSVATDGMVNVDRLSFIDPEVAFPARRALRLIHCKQTDSLGQIINGGPLPPNIIPQPHSAFDERGRFIASCDLDDQGRATPSADLDIVPDASAAAGSGADASTLPDVAKVPISAALTFPPAIIQHPADIPSTIYLPRPVVHPGPAAISVNEMVKEITKDLFHEVIGEMCENLSDTIVNACRCFLQAEHVTELIISIVITPLIKEISDESFKECTMAARESQARERALKSASCERVAQSVTEDQLTAALTAMCQDLATDFHTDAIERARSMRAVADLVLSDILGKTCASETANIAAEFHRVEVVERLKVLDQCCRTVETSRVAVFWKNWKNCFAARIRLKRSMETFPSAPCMLSWQHQFSQLVPGSTGLSMEDASLDVGQNATLHSVADVREIQRNLVTDIVELRHDWTSHRNAVWRPIELAEMVHLFVPRSRDLIGTNICWKLVISEPNGAVDVTHVDVVRWLKAKLSKGSVPAKASDSQVEVCSLYTTRVSHLSVSVCVTSLAADVQSDELEDSLCLLGTTAILFVVTADRLQTTQVCQAERDRLLQLLSAKKPLPRIPLAVLCIGCHDDMLPAVADLLQLKRCLTDGLISDYSLHMLDGDVGSDKTMKNLHDAVQWLCQQTPCLPLPIQSQSLVDYIDDGLTVHYFTPVLQNLAKRRKCHLGHLDPGTLVLWYNGVVEWLADMATHEQLKDLSWPVKEFAVDQNAGNLNNILWNTDGSFSQLRDVILSLTLPDLDLSTPALDWPAAVNDVWLYVSCLIDGATNDTDSSSAAALGNARLCSRVRQLLLKTETRLNDTVMETSDDELLEPPSWLPWTDIISACVEYQLTQLHSAQLIVYYSPELLQRELPTSIPLPVLPPCPPDQTAAEKKCVETLPRNSQKRKHSTPVGNLVKLPRSLPPQMTPNCSAVHNTSSSIADVTDVRSESQKATWQTTERLNLTLEKERRESNAYESFLRSVISEQDARGKRNETEEEFATPVRAMPKTFTSPSSAARFLSNTGGDGRSVRFDICDSETETSARRSSLDNRTLHDKMFELNSALLSEKEANKLFEMHLLHVCLLE